MGFVRIAVFSVPAARYSSRRFVLLRIVVLIMICGPLVPCLSAQMPTPVAVPTWRYDLTHSGANTTETVLTPSNVNVATFGKLFSQAVDGSVYAQPLYLPGLTMGDGLLHNVVFVATEHDSVYAFDADTNGGANQNPLWKVTLLDSAHGAASGATTVPYTDVNCPDIAPEIGITATPVIDPSTNTMYVVSKSKESGTYVQRLHALDIFTGAEKTGSPVVIQATVAGTGTGSSGGNLAFSALRENNRTALNLYNGHVYIGFGSHGDISPYHGWLFAYDATTLAQTAVLCLSPDGIGNSIWAAGAGMPIDTAVSGGRMFLVAGNGTYSNIPPFNPTSDYGDSIVAIDLSNGQLTPTDIFTPFDQAHLASADLDEGSGGILMLPNQPGSYPHILVQAGKEGRIIVLDRDNLGGYAAGATSNTNALQDIPGQVQGMWSTPAYWNGNVYFWGAGDLGTPGGTPTMFQLNDGVLGTTPSSVSPISSKHPGGIFSVSSNGTVDGIAWAIRTDGFGAHTDAILYAWDATNLSNLLYESDTNSTRDNPGQANKFAVPVVTNGKVYVSAVKQITVYGLLDDNQIAAAPTISPNGGYFPTTQTVTISGATPSANIYYTLDGTVPTQASTLYTGPISISSNTTVQTIAAGAGYIVSPVTSATFTITPATPAVTFNPPGGIYTSTQTITLSETDPNAVVYYTTNGSTPTTSSTTYVGPLSVGSTATIKAIAVDSNLQPSPVATATYTIQAGAPQINFGSGFASITGLKLNGTATQSNSLLQLTSGKLYQAASAYWNQPIGIQTFTTDFTFQLLSAQTDGITFTIQNAGVTALGPDGPGIGYGAVKPGGTPGIGRSVAIKFDIYNNFGEGSDSTGVYTDGASPTIPATDMTSSGVLLRSGDTMQAHITYDGTTLSMKLTDTVNSKTFTFSQAINIPQIVGANIAFVGFTASTGSLTAIQNILTWTLTSGTP
jgi:Legume lectin domain/Chitobiase/beta-hexosaminidase C-terminal domain